MNLPPVLAGSVAVVEPDFPELDAAALATLPPAERILFIEQVLARHHLGMLDLLLGGAEAEQGRHYPPGDAWDPASQAQWFFHAHDPHGGGRLNPMPAECGHFHTFLGAGGMPRGIGPFVLPEMAVVPIARPVREIGDPATHLSGRDQGRFAHLIGMSIDDDGQPMALFTTNRWVTGEVWYRAQDLTRVLDRFAFLPTPVLVEATPMQRSAARALDIVSQWLSAVMQVLRPQIVSLLTTRDMTVMDWRRRRSRQNHVFDDRRLDVTSTMLLDFRAELQAARRR
jgi:hypothetical protein